MKATDMLYGPKTQFGQLIHSTKYRAPEENFDDYCVRFARTTSENEIHFRKLLRYLRDQVLLPAGRQQLSVGRPFQTTAFNCFVGEVIPDSMVGIMEALKNGAITMRSGGGMGWDFSSLRPQGELIRALGPGAFASGPISFMALWNTMCQTILSAGHRRGAMMGVLRCDHPDILKFINAKKEPGNLTNFNISVGITNEFLESLYADKTYPLKFGSNTYGDARAQDVWAVIMENNWDWAEPGVLFIDRINERNPLNYCETLYATNPCGEQPLPPWGCCLLGSLNIVKLLVPSGKYHHIDNTNLTSFTVRQYEIDYDLLDDATDCMVRAFDIVMDKTYYPLDQFKQEEVAKRRMGIGLTGVANALEIMGLVYGSQAYIDQQDLILEKILFQAYRTSIELAKEKGSFPLFDYEKYSQGYVFKNVLNEQIQWGIEKHGLRNGLLTSIAPTGTISMAADNVSSGIEPVFSHKAKRNVYLPGGQVELDISDYAVEFYGVKGKTADKVSGEEHIEILCHAQKYVDSAVSKTCNISGQISGQGSGLTFSEFKELYIKAWEGGAKGCTTFNINGKRMGMMKAVEEQILEDEGSSACQMNFETGVRSCDV